MRAQLKTRTNGSLPAAAVSLTHYIKYYNESESVTGFPGGKTFYHYSSVTKMNRYTGYNYDK